MASFREAYQNAIASIIVEGGNAIPNVSRIKREDIAKTVDDFKEKIIIPFVGRDPGDSMFLLGSTGKKKDSGDIDIGIDVKALSDKNILINLIKLNEICASNGFNSCINTINYNMIHIAFPQSGSSKFVQIDVLLTNDPRYVKFFMFSPAENESKYKGAHRNSLLRAIAESISLKPLAFDEDGEMIKWSQIDLSESGLMHQMKTLIDANGNRLKYKDTNEDLEFLYAKVSQEIPISKNPEFIVKYLVGSNFKVEDIDTFEKLFDIVRNSHDFRYSIIANKILQECAKILDASRNRLAFPDELIPYLKKSN